MDQASPRPELCKCIARAGHRGPVAAGMGGGGEQCSGPGGGALDARLRLLDFPCGCPGTRGQWGAEARPDQTCILGVYEADYLGLDSALLPSDFVTLGKQMNHSESVLSSKMEVVPGAHQFVGRYKEVLPEKHLRSSYHTADASGHRNLGSAGTQLDGSWALLLVPTHCVCLDQSLHLPGLHFLIHKMATKVTFVGFL